MTNNNKRQLTPTQLLKDTLSNTSDTTDKWMTDYDKGKPWENFTLLPKPALKRLYTLLCKGKIMVGHGAPKYNLNRDSNIFILNNPEILNETNVGKINIWRNPNNTTKTVHIRTTYELTQKLDLRKIQKRIQDMHLRAYEYCEFLVSNPGNATNQTKGNEHEPQTHSYLLLEILNKDRQADNTVLTIRGRVILVNGLKTKYEFHNVLHLHRERVIYIRYCANDTTCVVYAHLSSAF